MKTIGILGGMGPEATAELYMNIVRIFQKKYGAKYDKDFPPMIIYSLPIPDVVEESEDKSSVVKLLVEGVRKLESAGADFIVIACNTVQLYLQQMQNAIKIPIISIASEAIRAAKRKGYSAVGLLATELTLNGLYDDECLKQNIQLIKPNKKQRKIVTKAIMNVLEGKSNMKKELKKIVRELQAETIILGCTELPLAIKQEDVEIELLDTTEITARAAVRECRINLNTQGDQK